ncbi:zinc binding alcohol dehydrogenase domain containing 2 [Elysia marginata]|uniref:Zinc binding alcohol dehydrogenase domain containing 2 n=1 Tax=Elysia marginata TaxID=1093978 RepID=A0AAV4FVN4_9GAST|nr:zinc binding alcohol dehydrogenase domain containing 2 [Elysia marginata]
MAPSEIPTHMNQVVVKKYGTNFRECTELVEVPVPSPGPGEALVRTTYVSINAAEMLFLGGFYSSEEDLPMVMGFEGMGEVVLPGEGSSRTVGQNLFIRSFGGIFSEYPGGKEEDDDDEEEEDNDDDDSGGGDDDDDEEEEDNDDDDGGGADEGLGASEKAASSLRPETELLMSSYPHAYTHPSTWERIMCDQKRLAAPWPIVDKAGVESFPIDSPDPTILGIYGSGTTASVAFEKVALGMACR